MNTRFDVGDKAYLEVTILGITITSDGIKYLVRYDDITTVLTEDKYLLNPPEGITKESTSSWKIQKATEAIMNGVDCAEIASALDMMPEEVEDLKTQLDYCRGGKPYE